MTDKNMISKLREDLIKLGQGITQLEKDTDKVVDKFRTLLSPNDFDEMVAPLLK